MKSGPILAAGLLVLVSVPAAAQQMMMMPASQAELIRGLLPSVVNITTLVADAAPPLTIEAGSQVPGRPKAFQGSGLIIDPSGVVLTNAHVIAGAYAVEVMFSDGVRVPGQVISTAPSTDLALVKLVPPHPLAAVSWADSDKVQIGDPVFAIGNPLGVGLSVSSGIVSALNRNIMDTPYDDFIQTDAAINHGNSGGPLFNRDGEVIGIDTAILSPTTGSVGLGFAIPANDAHFVTNQMLHNDHVRPAYLGVRIEQVTADMATALGLPAATGSIVNVVDAGQPGSVAGLQVGDVILRYNNETPSDERALLRAVAKSPIGQAVPAVVLRAGQERAVQIVPIAWPESENPVGTSAGQAPRAIVVPENLGLQLSPLTADLRTQHGLRMQQAGVLVGGVAAGTDAFERGLAPGDVILRTQDSDVGSPQEVQAEIEAARARHKAFIMVLVQPKAQQGGDPHWMALRVSGS
ncbi:MAG TPA: trypsin-like peptidase domain-containing protein [Acetobacteraceae bacterium]|jgi:serine protease Do